MHKLFGLLFAVGLATPAQAQVVYRCVAKSGAISYQSDACPVSSAVGGVYNATPDSAAEVARARGRSQVGTQADVPVSSVPHSLGTRPQLVTQRDKARAECAAAKADRESTLERVGIRRTFDLLRALDERVYDACKTL